MANLLTALGAINESPASSAAIPAAPTAPASDIAKAAGAQATQQAALEREPTMAEVRQAARQLETFMESMNRYLEFRIDQDSGRTVVTVKDKTTGDVVRQIPTEEVLRLAQNLGGKGHTGLVNQTA
jgi:flagellar protein FlaG